MYDAADGTGAMRPPKSKLTSVTVGTDGTVLISDLEFAHRYVAGTDIGGVWTALGFTTEPATAPTSTDTPLQVGVAEFHGHSYAAGYNATDLGLAFPGRVGLRLGVERPLMFAQFGTRTHDNFAYDTVTGVGAFSHCAVANATLRAWDGTGPPRAIIDYLSVCSGINDIPSSVDPTATMEALRMGVDYCLATHVYNRSESQWAFSGGTNDLYGPGGPSAWLTAQKFAASTDEGKVATFTVPAGYSSGHIGFHHALAPGETATVTARRNGATVGTNNFSGVVGAGGVVSRGAYAGGTAYVLGDVVVSGGLYYMALLPTTGNSPPGAQWRQVPVPNFCRRYPCVAGDVFTLTYTNIVGAIHLTDATLEGQPAPPVALMNVAKPAPAWNQWNGGGGYTWTSARIDQWNSQLAAVAADFDTVTVVDIDTALGQSPANFSSDNLHPNDLGHDLIARQCVTAFPARTEAELAAGSHPSSPGYATLTLFNSFAAVGSPYASPSYRAGRMVWLQGRVKNTNTGAAVQVALLPVHARPASTLEFPVSVLHPASTLVANVVQVQADGQVLLKFADATTNYELSLDGVSFPAER